MIKELYQYLTSKATSEAKKLGYLYSSIALEERFIRCQKAWLPHIEKCHESILSVIPTIPSRIGIIGSGYLFEIPWEIMFKQGHHLTLIDIYHPKKIKELAKKFPLNISLLEIDITGFSSKITTHQFSPENFLDFNPPSLGVSFDYVISANILSQLALNSLNFLQKRNSIFKLESLNTQFIQKTGDDHWNWLKTLAPQVLLFSDVFRNYRSSEDSSLIEKQDSTFTLNYPHINEWTWLISPIGEQSNKYFMEMIVRLYIYKEQKSSQ